MYLAEFTQTAYSNDMIIHQHDLGIGLYISGGVHMQRDKVGTETAL